MALKIRRLPSASPPPPPAPPPPAPPPPPADWIGGLFRDPAGALRFLSMLARATEQPEAYLRRSPNGDFWIAVRRSDDVSQETMILAAAGRPFHGGSGRWSPSSSLGLLSTKAPSEPAVSPDQWPSCPLTTLVASLTLKPTRPTSISTADVFLPPPLLRLALRRALRPGVNIGVSAGRRSPALGPEQWTAVFRMRLAAERGDLPAALLHSLGELPSVVVAHSTQAQEGRLMIDARGRLPLDETLLPEVVPDDEALVLTCADESAFRFSGVHEAMLSADSFLTLASPAAPETSPPLASPTSPPRPTPTRLTALPPGSAASNRVDAVLVDDQELDWVRRFLVTRPLDEEVWLLPGPDRHLVTASGGLPFALPFGTPLIALPPGGLYVEVGFAFQPPLSEDARRSLFRLSPDAVVVLTEDGARRFSLQAIVPAWTLWAAPIPIQDAPPSVAAQTLLERLQNLAQKIKPLKTLSSLRPFSAPKELDRPRLRRDAQAAEIAGDYRRAAELLEQVGDFGPAGRLYERAARAPR